jgi:hypothetical protein
MSAPGLSQEEEPVSRAVEIIKAESEDVLTCIKNLLDSSQQSTTWEQKHITNTIQVFSEHVKNIGSGKRLEVESKERIAIRRQNVWLAITGICSTLILSLLFLYYDKAEFIAAVITGVSGFAGGFGVGSTRKTD